MKKTMACCFIIVLGSLASAASVVPLTVVVPPGWTFHLIQPGSPMANFSQGAEAFIGNQAGSLDEMVDVYVYKIRAPIPAALNQGSKTAWHKYIFSKAATAKVSFLEEFTRKVGHQWRYYVRYETNNGVLMDSIGVGVLVGNQVHLFMYENSRQIFSDHVTDVKNLLSSIKVPGN